MTGAGGLIGLIVKLRVLVPVPAEFVALSATLKVPEELGVPEIKPVVVLTDTPGGSPVASKLVGPLVAVIW